MATDKIVRFSVSLENDLLEDFDRYCQCGQFATRSEAVRQMIRDTLTRQSWDAKAHDVAGTLTLVYDHHRSQIRDQLSQDPARSHRLCCRNDSCPPEPRSVLGGDCSPWSCRKAAGNRITPARDQGSSQGRTRDGQRRALNVQTTSASSLPGLLESNRTAASPRLGDVQGALHTVAEVDRRH